VPCCRNFSADFSQSGRLLNCPTLCTEVLMTKIMFHIGVLLFQYLYYIGNCDFGQPKGRKQKYYPFCHRKLSTIVVE
jgi:hypothetical protein